MVGNAKFELNSVSQEDLGFAGPGRYASGPQGARSGASSDRFGSFRENSSTRAFSYGANMPKGKASNLPLLSQCMSLEPFKLVDQKCSRSGELKRVLGFSLAGFREENSYGAANCIEELKHFRESVLDSSDKARIRSRVLEDSLNILTTYLHRLQLNEKSREPKVSKTGAFPHVKLPDSVMHEVGDRVKNVLSKRSRTPVADLQVERGTGIPRQHMVLAKDNDVINGNMNSDFVEDKMCRLSTGGESWDRTMKRKRSVSSVFSRPVDSDGDIKRAMQGRLTTSSDAPTLRVCSNGGAGNTKFDGSPSASGSSGRPTPKSKTEKFSFTRNLGGSNKERILQTGNNKFNSRDENHLTNPGFIAKGKASRALRVLPPMSANTSPTSSHTPSTPEDWELQSSVNQIQIVKGISSRKGAFPSETSSPPMAQWGGQRPQKVSRIRRANITSPAFNNDDVTISSEGCAVSDYASASGGLKSMASNVQQIKVNSESNCSPSRLSEGEETDPAEIRPVGSLESEEIALNGYLHGGSPGLLTKKTKLLVKEQTGDGVRRQGQNERQVLFSRGSTSPLGENVDSPAAAKPVRSIKPSSDKNGSKSGRPPLKKHTERKGFTRLGRVPNGTSSDCRGESDDDRKDLLAAAMFTCNANYQACSSLFWKKMEPLFSITVEDKSFLTQQLKQLEEFSHGFESNMSEASVKHARDGELSCDAAMPTSLYQRLLSSLIVEDESEDVEHNICGENLPFFSGNEDCSPMEGMILSNEDTYTIETPQPGLLQEGYCSFTQSEGGVLPASSQGNLNGLLTSQINMPSEFSSDSHYAKMSLDEKLQVELQSIGLHPKTARDLGEGVDEAFSGEILVLQRQFQQETNKKKSRLQKIWKAVAVEMELKQWELEQTAVSRLVVLAYRKLLATRGSTAAKIGITKASRQVAMACVRRTLARCRRFEQTGKSCFTEPALWDLIVAGPSLPSNNVFIELPEARTPGSNPTSTGPIPNGGKKKEILLDEFFNSAAPFKPSHLSKNAPNGGSKGKRTERDRDKFSPAKSKQKAKAKPKQRASSHFTTHPVGPSTSSRKQGTVLGSSGEGGTLAGLNSIELQVVKELEGHQDLSSWLSLDDDVVLQDHDGTMGLEIPMDDLSDLSMLL